LGWNQSALDDWLRHLLPKPFEWLDACFGRPDLDSNKFHWVLLRKDRTTLFVVERDPTTGADVAAAKGTVGRKFTDHAVRIGQSVQIIHIRFVTHRTTASREPIPYSVYCRWGGATERTMDEKFDGQELGKRHSQIRLTSRTKVDDKGYAKPKGKTYGAVKQNRNARVEDSESDVIPEIPVHASSDSEIDSVKFTGMGKGTRLARGERASDAIEMIGMLRH